MRDLVQWEISLSAELRLLLVTARDVFHQKEDFEALYLYMELLERLVPADRLCIHLEVLNVLQACQRISMLRCFKMKMVARLYDHYPMSSEVCCFYARQLFYQEKYFKCVQMYKQAVQHSDLSDKRIRYQVELDNARTNLFDQWHFAMINDGKRNQQFALAIQRQIQRIADEKPQHPIHIMDLGCGTGILSTIIVKELEKHFEPGQFTVSALDYNDTMFHVAKQVFDRNNTQIQPIFQHSTKFHSEQPINLIVSETLDCAVFGEGFVSSIVDLKQRLSPDAGPIRVLPSRATIYMALCEAKKIEQTHFCRKSNEKSDYVMLSEECYLNWALCEEQELNDPYDSANLDDLDGGYRLLSEPVDLMTVDFNDFNHLETVILRNKFEGHRELRANVAGRACCIAVWFTLDIGDDARISTAPGQRSCWHQAIFPFYPPSQMEVGDKLELNVCVYDEKLYICPTNLAPAPEPKTRILKSTDLVAMNSQMIESYYYESIDKLKPTDVVDYTELIIKRKEELNFRYLCLRGDLATLTGEQVCSKQEECQRQFKITKNNRLAFLHFPFNSLGCLDPEKFEYAMEYVSFAPYALMVPSLFKLKGMLIESDQLRRKSTLVRESDRDETYCGVDITPMLDYYVRDFHELSMEKLEFKSASDPLILFEFSFTEYFIRNTDYQPDQILSTKNHFNIIDQTLKPNAMLYWLEMATGGDGPQFSFLRLPSCLNARVFEEDMNLGGKQKVRVDTSMCNCQFVFGFS